MAEIHPILVGNRWKTADRELSVLNPHDGSVAGRTYLGGAKELDEGVKAAHAAFEVFKRYPAYKRAEVLQKTSVAITARAEELAMTITLEAGKPINDSRAEVKRAAMTFHLALEEAKRLEGEVMPLDIMPGSEGRFGIIRRFPAGVVLGISPFNFPLNLVAHKVAPALACGCPIIIKPSSKTPLTALKLGEIITEAGCVEGGLSVIPARAVDAERLLDDARVKKLTFTGSAEVGWRLSAKANRIKTTLELGGDAGVIVHDDADVAFAAKRCAMGAFSFAGQICISVQRIYVQKKVFAAFRDAFIKEAESLKLGDPLQETTNIGPMIDEAALGRTEERVAEAIGQGAILLTGGRRDGRCFQPTVLTNTKPDMSVCSEEVFAPVAVLEGYGDFEEAISLVNRSRFGLQAGIFTNGMDRVFSAYNRLEVGGVVINDAPTYRTDNMPYGGVKMSGFGREGVRYAIEEMTELKLLAIKGS